MNKCVVQKRFVWSTDLPRNRVKKREFNHMDLAWILTVTIVTKPITFFCRKQRLSENNTSNNNQKEGKQILIKGTVKKWKVGTIVVAATLRSVSDIV